MIFVETNKRAPTRKVCRKLLGMAAAAIALGYGGVLCEAEYIRRKQILQRVEFGQCRFAASASFERTNCRKRVESAGHLPAGSFVHWQTVVAHLDWTLHAANGTQLGEVRHALGKCPEPDYLFDSLGRGCRCTDCQSLPRFFAGPDGHRESTSATTEAESGLSARQCQCSAPCYSRARQLLRLYGTTPLTGNGGADDTFVGAKPGHRLACWYEKRDSSVVRFSVQPAWVFYVLNGLAWACSWGCIFTIIWSVADVAGLARPFAHWLRTQFKKLSACRPYIKRAVKAFLAFMMLLKKKWQVQLERKHSSETFSMVCAGGGIQSSGEDPESDKQECYRQRSGGTSSGSNAVAGGARSALEDDGAVLDTHRSVGSGTKQEPSGECNSAQAVAANIEQQGEECTGDATRTTEKASDEESDPPHVVQQMQHVEAGCFATEPAGDQALAQNLQLTRLPQCNTIKPKRDSIQRARQLLRPVKRIRARWGANGLM